MGEKTRFYHIFAAFLVVVFLFLNVYSLWFGAKNTGDIITITDSFTLSSDKTGTSVYLSDSLKEKGDIHRYHFLTDDSMAVRFAGYLSKFISPLYVWIIINILSTLFIIYMLISLISSEGGILKFVLVALFPFFPGFFRGSVQLGAYTLCGALVLCVIYIGTIKGASVIKWYLAMALCAIVVSVLPEFWIIVYIIPFVAYRDIKISYDGGRAASHILLLLLTAIIIHFAYLRAFADYSELYSYLTGTEYLNSISGIRYFMCFDSVEKIGIYLPAFVMAVVSFVGLFFVEKYVRKYIYPGVFLYIWMVLFAPKNSYVITVIYPVLFFAFSKTLIHVGFLRTIKKYVTVSLCILLPLCILCCINISYSNHTKGLLTTCYVQEYAKLYDEYAKEDSLVLSVTDERKSAMHMYAAYPKKTILSVPDEKEVTRIADTYRPCCVVSEYEISLEGYEKVLNEEGKYVYTLYVK